MNFRRVMLGGGQLWAAVPAQAGDPPEKDQGKSWVLGARSGLSGDANRFGAVGKNVESSVFQIAPKAADNASLIDQAFLARSYRLTVDQFDHRPGDKALESPEVSARIAPVFSAVTNRDALEILPAARNPGSLLSGAPIHSHHANDRNEVNVTFFTAPTAKTGLTFKARAANTGFRAAVLSRRLDRTQHLFGVSGSNAIWSEDKTVAETLHQDGCYLTSGEAKNNAAADLMAGLDCALAKKSTASARAGFAWRHRDAEPSTISPLAEVSETTTPPSRRFSAAVSCPPRRKRPTPPASLTAT